MKLTRKETAVLRQLAQEAWEQELSDALEALFEDFCRWTDHGMSAFDLTDRIHEFHQGLARDLYKRYTLLPPRAAVAYAIARGALGDACLEAELLAKLAPEIEAFRDQEAE